MKGCQTWLIGVALWQAGCDAERAESQSPNERTGGAYASDTGGNGTGGVLGLGGSSNIAETTVTHPGVSSVALGITHSCAVVGDGAWCWGSNTFGALGDDTGMPSCTPVRTSGVTGSITAVAVSNEGSCAIVDGRVQCWGNHNRTYEPGMPMLYSTLVEVQGLSSSATAIGNDSVLADGRVYQLVLNDDESITAVQVQGLPSMVSAISENGKCAADEAGVQCWQYTVVPVAVGGLSSGVTAVAQSTSHSCAIVAGGVQCWGRNSNGGLGDGTYTDSSTPVEVEGLSSGVTAIAVGNGFSCAIAAGSVKCWGDNRDGALGDGTLVDSTAPVQVEGLSSGATTISAHQRQACAIVAGRLLCWGYPMPACDDAGPARVPVEVVGL